MAMFDGQRGARPTVAARRGASTSHSASAANTASPAPTRTIQLEIQVHRRTIVARAAPVSLL